MLPDIYGTPEDYEDDDVVLADDDVEDLTPEEEAIFGSFLVAADGDIVEAIKAFEAYEAHAAEVFTGQAAAEPESDLEAFLAANPALDDDDFRAHVDAANGDIGQAIETYGAWLSHIEDAATEYDQDLERPRTMDEAFEQSFREGLIGNRDKLYRYKPSAYDNSLENAVGEWVEEDSASRAVRDLARERVNEAALGERDGF